MSYNKETGMYEGYIYKITNDINDKIYIGQTITDIQIRWRGHKSLSNKDKDAHMLITRTMKKYGIEHFKIKEIYKVECKTKNELLNILNRKEKKFIVQYNSLSPYGYNLSEGGGSSYGTKTLTAIDVYNTSKELVYQFDSIENASISLDISYSTISHIINNRTHICNTHGYILKKKNEKITDEDVVSFLKNNPPITQYDIDGNIINEFDNLNDAYKYLCKYYSDIPINREILQKATSGARSYAYGFIWRRYPDNFLTYYIPKEIKKSEYLLIEKRNPYNGQLISKYLLSDLHKEYSKQNIRRILVACNNIDTKPPCSVVGYYWCYQNEFNNRIFMDFKVDRYSLKGEYIDSFDKLSDISEELKISIYSIKDVCDGNRNSKGGYVWRYSGEPFDKYHRYHSKPVVCYDLNGNMLSEHKSLLNASNSYDVSKTLISQCCKGKVSVILDEYVFRYKGDDFNKYNIDHTSNSKKVYQYTLDKVLINIFESCTSAAKSVNMSPLKMSNICCGKKHNDTNYIWSYEPIL